MKYFMDFEFLEGDIPVKIFGLNIPKWLIKPNNTIQPISIGLVSSDDREYYAISKDFNLYEAWNRLEMKYDNPLPPIKNRQMGYSGYLAEEAIFRAIPKKVYWIRENVLKPIYTDLLIKDYSKKLFISEGTSEYRRLEEMFYDSKIYTFTLNNFKRLLFKYGKSNKQIVDEIKMFIGTKETVENYEEVKHLLNPQFYGYYSAYDHVALCWLFGKMIDLPKGFPMYCNDLKQEFDRICIEREKNWMKESENKFDMETHLKTLPNYPKQTNEHNALADAKWNKELYEFLKNIAQ